MEVKTYYSIIRIDKFRKRYLMNNSKTKFTRNEFVEYNYFKNYINDIEYIKKNYRCSILATKTKEDLFFYFNILEVDDVNSKPWIQYDVNMCIFVYTTNE